MATISASVPGAHGFEEFAAVVEDDLLRAAWLLTADRMRAAEVTEVALGQVSAGWTRQRDDRPVQQAYAALLRAVARTGGTVARTAPAPEPTDQVGRLQGATEQAFSELPTVERNAIVLHRYSNLSSQRTADLLHMTPAQVEQNSAAALGRLRAKSTDLAELPFDRVPTPGPGIDPSRIQQYAAQDTGMSRRRMLGWTGAAAAVAAITAGGWWWRRPYTGDPTLAGSLLPTQSTATGQLFSWLQGLGDAPLGTGAVNTQIYGGDRPPARVLLRRVGSTPSVSLDGRAVTLQRTRWGDRSAPLTPIKVDNDLTLPVTLVVAAVPTDTDACWGVGAQDVAVQSEASGIELRDHSTYAVVVAIGESEIAGVLWRTAGQQIGLNTGERTALTPSGDVMLFVLPRAGIWGAVSGAQWLTCAPLPSEAIDGPMDQEHWRFLYLLPEGATAVKVHYAPHYSQTKHELVSIEGTRRSVVVASSSPRDPLPDGAVPGVVDRLDWVGADGKPGRWTRPTPESFMPGAKT